MTTYTLIDTSKCIPWNGRWDYSDDCPSPIDDDYVDPVRRAWNQDPNRPALTDLQVLQRQCGTPGCGCLDHYKVLTFEPPPEPPPSGPDTDPDRGDGLWAHVGPWLLGDEFTANDVPSVLGALLDGYRDPYEVAVAFQLPVKVVEDIAETFELVGYRIKSKPRKVKQRTYKETDDE